MRKSIIIGCLLLVAVFGAMWLRMLVTPTMTRAPNVATIDVAPPVRTAPAQPEPKQVVATARPTPVTIPPSERNENRQLSDVSAPIEVAANAPVAVVSRAAPRRAPASVGAVRHATPLRDRPERVAAVSLPRRPSSPRPSLHHSSRSMRLALNSATPEAAPAQDMQPTEAPEAPAAPEAVTQTTPAAPPTPAAPVLATGPTPTEQALAPIPAEPAQTVALPVDSPLATPVETPAPTETVLTLSAGSARIIRAPRPLSSVFVADDKVADVHVKGPDTFYLIAKSAGLTSVQTTDASGAVTWSSDVRVGINLADADRVLRTAMPEAAIRATPIAGVLLLTGTVAQPADVADAERLATQLTAGTVPVVTRLKVATPQQVNLQVKIAEVSRSVSRAIGFNYKTADGTGGFVFGVAQGRSGAVADDLSSFTHSGVGTTLALGGKLLGLDIRQVIDLAETDGLATSLAEPNLTALSGETASFLAGGEIPIPQSQGLGTVSVEFKQYGVSLAFTPTVLANGRIALRVRPEVSQLTDVGAVKISSFTIPALITRRAETTVELGSGQSFAIGGLLQNSHNNSVDKAPVLGDLPVIGALFRSNAFKKSETELVIVVTPYLVKPVDANRVALPTDGYRAPTTAQRVLGDASYLGTSGEHRPTPHPAATTMSAGALGAATSPQSAPAGSPQPQ